MSVWLLITPLVAWIVALTVGRHFIRSSPEEILRHSQPFRTDPLPYDERQWAHRFYVHLTRAVGWLFVAFAAFLTLMALLIVAGVVAPAPNTLGAK